MIENRLCRRIVATLFQIGLAVGVCSGTEIHWFSELNRTNLTSTGTAMDGGFRFELGVFANGFVPTAANVAGWVANWRPATSTGGNVARLVYQSGTSRFDGVFEVDSNAAPFTAGVAAYVWGFRGWAGPSEWVLFRHTSWTWPQAALPGPPGFPLEWEAKDATAVVGSINAAGSPFLMQSAAVSQASPPTTWAQWQAENLAGVSLDGPDDDPDGDGVTNLMEYVFGLPPGQAGAPSLTPASFVGGYLQLSVPRRPDHTSALLTVEVSPDLVNWDSGPGYTVEVSNTIAALVVRDATAAPVPGKRFMRLRADLP